ncbi:MAG TPA: ABC transporter ATP-binding protein, partial [Ktedonobacterales bacterium]|nr:ABC transporter ATP-binding protein [Ktedonobacterales bacterium]
AISADGLTKRYGAFCAVEDVSLRVGHGEIYAFLGLNGAGKTTTIRMLLGMIRPTSGSATLLGKRVDADARALWAQVGYLVETPHAYPELTVRENLEVFRRLRGLREPNAVERIIERLGLTTYADQRAGTLSLGNAQRLGLAKALLHEPALLLLDEPANGLDPSGVVEIRELLRELAHEQGVTIFLSSHLLGEVVRIATRFGVIHQGRLLVELSAAEMERERTRWLVVDARDRAGARSVLTAAGFAVETGAEPSNGQNGTTGALRLSDAHAIAHPEEVARQLVGAGIELTRLSVEEEDLESQFLRLVGATPATLGGVEHVR